MTFQELHSFKMKNCTWSLAKVTMLLNAMTLWYVMMGNENDSHISDFFFQGMKELTALYPVNNLIIQTLKFSDGGVFLLECCN